MSWGLASGFGAGLAIATLAANPWDLAGWIIVAANLWALVRHCRGGGDWDRGYAAGVQAERKRVARVALELIAARGGR